MTSFFLRKKQTSRYMLSTGKSTIKYNLKKQRLNKNLKLLCFFGDVYAHCNFFIFLTVEQILREVAKR